MGAGTLNRHTFCALRASFPITLYMKNILVWLIIGIIIVGLVLVKIFVIDADKKTQGGGGKPGQAPSPVTVAVVKSSLLSNNITVTGDIIANEEVELRPEINGKVIRIYFSEGAQVKKGQLLVKINDVDLQAQLRKLKAQLSLSDEKKGRLESLLKINGVSQEDYDIALNESQSLSADIDLVKANIEKTEIYAPFDGIVGLKSISEGSYVTPANVIATVQQLRPLKIDFSVPERYASIITPNSNVTFTTRTDDTERSAKVYAIEPKIDPATRSLKIRALYPNADLKLYPGSFAQIKLALTEDIESFLVPTQVLIPGVRGAKAFIIKDGKAKGVEVETGFRNDSTIQILKGLNEGDSLVVTGVMVLRDGGAVKVLGAKKK